MLKYSFNVTDGKIHPDCQIMIRNSWEDLTSKTVVLSSQGPLRLSWCPHCCIKYVVPVCVNVNEGVSKSISNDPQSTNFTGAPVTSQTLYK